ncbi:MAG: FAD binding domain-containing protein [Oscillibacter sp.]|nr:FAD binding domain-containing protein [Oscillibacter sp.]
MVNGYAAASLREALEIRASRDVVPYAGGTDLMIENRKGVRYLFLNKVPELKAVAVDDRYVRIGAAVTFTEALACPDVPRLMKEALSRIAAPAIRNAGTFGGNLGNGSAKADTALIEVAADGKVCLASAEGGRVVDVDKFYLGRKKLDLADNELITEILLPKKGLEQYSYEKVGGREALAISRVSFAGVFAAENGKITNIAAAFGAVADTILRYKDIEAMLLGKTVQEAKGLKADYLNAYAQRMTLTRGRVSAEYRKRVCMNLLNGFLTKFGI